MATRRADIYLVGRGPDFFLSLARSVNGVITDASKQWPSYATQTKSQLAVKLPGIRRRRSVRCSARWMTLHKDAIRGANQKKEDCPSFPSVSNLELMRVVF